MEAEEAEAEGVERSVVNAEGMGGVCEAVVVGERVVVMLLDIVKG